MLQPTLQKNDKKAKIVIISISIIVFLAITALGKYTFNINLPFNKHLFATVNAFINATVAVLLIVGLVTIKQKKYVAHKNIMLLAIVLSVLFLVSYICHHLLTNPTLFGDTDNNGLVSDTEKTAVGAMRSVYIFLLLTHIPLAGIILPFILFSAYKALIGEYDKHKKLVRYTWPIWFYVAVTGVIIYVMINPYYH